MATNQSHLFSVIIPTYNRASLVSEAIRSVFHQSLQDYELIVVDDGSTDGSGEMLKDLFSDRIHYIYQENRGPAAARNHGAREAKGQYLAFLDSDDLWRPQKLEKQKEFFASHTDYHICQTEEIWLRNGKRVFPKQRHKKLGGFIFHRAVELCLVSPSAVAIDRELFWSVGGFDESLPAAEDYDLWLRLLCRHPIGLIEQPLVVKRAGSWDQLSFTTEAIDRYRIKALSKILESGSLTEEQTRAAQKALQKKADIYIAGCLKRGKTEEVKRIKKMMAHKYKDNILDIL